MWITYKLVTLEELYSDRNLELSDQFFLAQNTMASIEREVQNVANSTKPVVMVNTVFYLHQEDLDTLQHTTFIIFETADILIASSVPADVDGFKIAATAVRYEMFLPPRGTY